MKKSDLIKQVVKHKVGETSTLRNNPRTPWAGVDEETISETPLLNRYLKSRGIDPGFATKDQKVAHSKTLQFKKWMRDHQNDVVREEITTLKKETHSSGSRLKKAVTAQKEIKTPHGPGSQNESAEQIDELSYKTLDSYHKKATGDLVKRGAGIVKAVNKKLKMKNQTGGGPAAEYAKARPGKYMGDSVEVDGQPIQEISSELLGRYKEKAKKSADELHSQEKYGKSADRQMNIMKATGKQIEKTTAKIKKSLNTESQLEPCAADNQPWDGANNPEDTIKSSRSHKLKLLLGGKKKPVNEDLYDHEKDNKPNAGFKKPKMQKLGVDGETKETPQAAAVLSGGKTMTGEPRDTIEIDPMMKMRKQKPGSEKSV